MMKLFVSILLHGILVAGVIANDLVYLSDEFDDASTISNWSRIYQVEGWNNNVLETFDIDTTRPGQMVMMPYSSSWYEEWRGELSYKVVTGNFVVTTFVEPRNRAGTGRPEQDYSLAGIMVRTPRTMTTPAEWTPNGQNYVFLSMGAANRTSSHFQFEVKTTINSTSILDITATDATRAAIQVARIGPHVIALRRDEGSDWIVHRRYFRPDFPETMQVGLTVYTDWNTCSAVGVINQNLNILTNGVNLPGYGILNNAQPDLVANFEYVRYARPQIPAELIDENLSNQGSVTDQQLLTFLGEAANIPGGASTPAEFVPDVWSDDSFIRITASVVSQRSYRVQSADTIDGPWNDHMSLVSTNTTMEIEHIPDPAQTEQYFRVVSP